MKTRVSCVSAPSVLLSIDQKTVAPVRTVSGANAVRHIFPGGLEAVATATRTGAFVQWAWSLRNTSRSPSGVVTAFRPLLLHLPCRGRLAPIIHGSRGGLDDGRFPPSSWTQWSMRLATEALSFKPVTATSAYGRSSNNHLPFLIVEDPGRRGGLAVGIGWSGDWDFHASRSGETVTVHAGMTNLGLSLRPGESFAQPTILTGRYEGSVADGQRALRRFLRDHIQPRLAGRPVPPLTFWDNYYGDRGQFTQADLLREMPLAAQAGLDYFVLDGGWTGGGMDAQFQSLLPHIGSWRPDPKRFAKGLAPLAQVARRQGLRVGLWFDVERAHEESLAYREHPELFFAGPIDCGCHLLRLDLPDATDWACQAVARNIRHARAGWIRFDFNSNPAAIWMQNDSPGRRGVTEIRYVENLYRLLDRLREQFPGLVIENCASGGRRIDLETIRRTHTDWISDHTQSEDIIRYHIHGAARWLPANRVGTSFAHAFLEPHRPVDWSAPLPAAAYLSHFGGSFSVSDRLRPMSRSARAMLRRARDAFARTAGCFAGDIHPFGRQDDLDNGPAGLAAVDSSGQHRAVLLFGVNDGQAAGLVPAEFRDLLPRPPLMGDVGNAQFAPAWLWTDAPDRL